MQVYHTTNWLAYPHGVCLDPLLLDHHMHEILDWCRQQWNPEEWRFCVASRSIACATHAQAVELMVTWGGVT